MLKADTRRFFDDTTPNEFDYIVVFHGYEHRLGLIQESTQGSGAYRAHSGEYVGETDWEWDNPPRPFAEAEFLGAEKRDPSDPWHTFNDQEVFMEVIEAHREV